jgi:hypothetical protein
LALTLIYTSLNSYSSSGELAGSSQSGKRIRVNVSRTSKGARSFEATVEMNDASIEEALAESDRLVAQLEARYPVTEVDITP